jgi:hypothetical protein
VLDTIGLLAVSWLTLYEDFSNAGWMLEQNLVFHYTRRMQTERLESSAVLL